MAPAQLMDRLSTLEQENAQLRAQLNWFKRNLFGTGKSEKSDALQLRLGLSGEAPVEPQQQPETIQYKKAKGKPRTMPAERFKDLPVHETIELIPEPVQAQPELYQRIGEEVTFEVDITPPKLFKRQIARPKFRHKLDPSLAPLLRPAVPRAIEGGYASAGLLGYIALSKYLYHLPLYRQEKMSRHWGACFLGTGSPSREPDRSRNDPDIEVVTTSMEFNRSSLILPDGATPDAYRQNCCKSD